jgi:putative ABC transport system substrate-binding protein
MNRRSLITLLGGAAASCACWPPAARAQQPERMRRIGVLIGLASSADDPGAQEILRPFRQAMQDAGWIDGRNIRVEYRFGAGDLAKINASAADLVTLNPDLIYAAGLPPAQALHQKTRAIPIVFTLVADPVGFGLVATLARPGGNVTGFMVWEFTIGGKWLQLLRELTPEVRHVGILYNPDTGPYAAPLIASARVAAGSDVMVSEHPVRDVGGIEAATSLLGKEPHSGLLVIPEPFTNAHRDQIIAQCARFGVPTMNPAYGATKRGALIGYTYSFDAMVRQPVAYVDRILKGESPGQLPVQTPTKFELSINLKTAKALGLTVPEKLLALADEVFE